MESGQRRASTPWLNRYTVNVLKNHFVTDSEGLLFVFPIPHPFTLSGPSSLRSNPKRTRPNELDGATLSLKSWDNRFFFSPVRLIYESFVPWQTRCDLLYGATSSSWLDFIVVLFSQIHSFQCRRHSGGWASFHCSAGSQLFPST